MVVSVGLGWPQDLEHESLNVVSIQLVVAINWVVNNALLLFSVVVLFIVWICCEAPGLIGFVGDCLFDLNIASMDRRIDITAACARCDVYAHLCFGLSSVFVLIKQSQPSWGWFVWLACKVG